MNLERFALRRRLVDYLCQARPALVERLKATRQLAPGGATPYHMDDGVWTHVMLVLQAALERLDGRSIGRTPAGDEVLSALQAAANSGGLFSRTQPDESE